MLVFWGVPWSADGRLHADSRALRQGQDTVAPRSFQGRAAIIVNAQAWIYLPRYVWIPKRVLQATGWIYEFRMI